MLIIDGAADSLEQALPRVTRVILPDARHVPWLEVPGEFASRLLDWLRETAWQRRRCGNHVVWCASLWQRRR